MSIDQEAGAIRGELERFTAEHGAFTAFCVHLGQGVYTMEPPRSDLRLKHFVQGVADLAGRPMDQLRILDLACLEGHYAVEFALQGAQAVGIEGRETNTRKARFLKKALGLSNLEFYTDDVRNLSAEKYGRFDVVLCAGLLYHLDFPDNVRLLEQIHEVCDRLAVIETYFSLKDEVSLEHGGHTYSGRYYAEHEEQATADQRNRNLWSSLDNVRSFWLTRSSLYNALEHVGFTTVGEQRTPWFKQPQDRVTFIALKGERVALRTSPLTEQEGRPDWPERPEPWLHRVNQPPKPLKQFGKKVLPQPVKNVIKNALYTVGLMKRPDVPDFLGTDRFVGKS